MRKVRRERVGELDVVITGGTDGVGGGDGPLVVLLHGFAVGLRVRQALGSPDARAPLKRLPNWMHTGLWAELIERIGREAPHQ